MSTESVELLGRIEKLERDAKRWKRVCIGVLLAVIIAGGGGTAVAANELLSVYSVTADIVMASRLLAHRLEVDEDFVVGGKLRVSEIYTQAVILTTHEGKRLGMFGGTMDGDRRLAFFDAQGKEQVTLKADDSGSSLSLAGANAPTILVRASTFAGNESAGLSIDDRHGKQRLELSLFGSDEGGGPIASVKLTGVRTHNVASLNQNEYGGSLHLSGENGSVRIST